MAGLDPAIHVFCRSEKKDVDARDKRGHDEMKAKRLAIAPVDRRHRELA